MTLQYFDDDGTRHEALGVLERVDVVEGEPVLAIRRRDDSMVRVPLQRIRAGKVVEEPRRRRGGP